LKLAIEGHSMAAAGETRSGDTFLVRRADDITLVAVIDVLGHGVRAADVADQARAHLESIPLTLDAGRVMQSLHQALRGTRGAAATLCLLQGTSLSGCGVGNVELRAQGCQLPISLNPGILGQNVRQMRVFEGELRAGNRLIWFSDGISSRLDLERVRHLAPRDACRTIFSNYRKSHDDATLVIADVEVTHLKGSPASTRGGERAET
jgi:phosphoserine phosphatase RsbX